MPQVTTEYGTDENGKLLYSREEYERLEDHADNLGEDAFADFVSAKAEGRVIGQDSDAQITSTKTRQEYEAMPPRHRADFIRKGGSVVNP